MCRSWYDTIIVTVKEHNNTFVFQKALDLFGVCIGQIRQQSNPCNIEEEDKKEK